MLWLFFFTILQLNLYLQRGLRTGARANNGRRWRGIAREFLLSLSSAFAPTKRRGEEEEGVTRRGFKKPCFAAAVAVAAGRRPPPAALEAARRRDESIGVGLFSTVG